ncbi:MAG: hypothetical protein US42_C0017G0007 [Candidatus Magasanikbacteria bacterium GW2011_GWC2_37_14]|uniref:Uncharacterized protein n=1 Tax=Candidatus Magasanikbacteria bacterium GW2011_GWC2_37_14 TaxID=1619046 RepID=A0A0G0JFQ7_9BACT|nr:MAG: hypothetical protein US42_C0017G0007 [Candidatus Magasanikbacteria bacterium GW2011_GWC2_37_14]
MTNNSASNSWQEGLRLMNQCPVCHNDFVKNQAQVIEETKGSNLVHLNCKACASTLLVLVVIGPLGMSSVGMITDLSFNDAKRLYKKSAISEDELLNFHTFLKNQQFNFKY